MTVAADLRTQNIPTFALKNGLWFNGSSFELRKVTYSVDGCCAWTAQLLKPLNLRPPLQPAKGYSISFPRAEVCPKVPLYLSEAKDFIASSVKWIVSHFEIDENKSIADFGCGPGLYTTSLAENNANVTGIDFSKRSINYARNVADQKGLNINYFQQNYLEFDTKERFDLITMIFCDFCALSPKQGNCN